MTTDLQLPPVRYKVYHVSPKANDASIGETGIDPKRAKGGYKSSWYCEGFQLNYVLAHCSFRHKIAVSDLRVWEAVIPSDQIMRTKWAGIYRVNTLILNDYLGMWDDTELQSWLRA